jgi:predicted trehalose synthase
LDAHILEKVVYEISYELNHRPEWVRIPVRGVREILETTASKAI